MGPKSRAGRFGGEKNLLPLRGFKFRLKSHGKHPPSKEGPQSVTYYSSRPCSVPYPSTSVYGAVRQYDPRPAFMNLVSGLAAKLFRQGIGTSQFPQTTAQTEDEREFIHAPTLDPNIRADKDKHRVLISP